ncbi:MAG: hypothetical protein AAFX87_27195 [Bacteroidota bacterium]
MKSPLTILAAMLLFTVSLAQDGKRSIGLQQDTTIAQKIPFDNLGTYETIKQTKVKRLVGDNRIHILQTLTNDSLDLRVIQRLSEHAIHYNLLVRYNAKEPFKMFDLKFPFNDTFLDAITVNQLADKQLFVFHFEKHNKWGSNYRRGASFHTGKMILYMQDDQLYRKYFKEYEELKEVDRRTGTSLESVQHQTIGIESERVSISYPDRTPPIQLLYRFDQNALILNTID